MVERPESVKYGPRTLFWRQVFVNDSIPPFLWASIDIAHGIMQTASTRRHYANAPITEAVIDIQIDNVSGKTIEDLTTLADRLKDEFPVRLPVYQLQVGFQTDAVGEISQHQDKQSLGWRLHSKDQKRVLQIRTNGFTYSHLPPYSNWETFSAEAVALWNSYLSAIEPQSARRLAVRVINRLPVDSSDGDLSTVVNVYPRVPDKISAEARSLAVQLQLPVVTVDKDALLNLSLFTGFTSNSEGGLILDIDLFIERPTAIGPQIFETINKLGNAKDDIFEACITDLIRERIQ
ncbi:TIGR04255 family protein [Bradyrhizobium sp. SZCCHNRI2007]|uniref:TIGR04255 family protein n=1 Tax=Bradyrhizobium sp. SZCCHNRI2007 TaxID=3057281 RepID=UPI0028E390BD|nr:TIGR04255 family protein [Bradyrhizobium sp. SZCCHNRI2007]